MWDQSTVLPSRFVIESLLERMGNTDFGIFIFAPDDLVEVRGVRYLIARDNVVLEFGMHIGRIGRHRCFMLLPLGSDVKLPSDIDGMTPILYDNTRTDDNIEAAVSPACNSLIREIKKHGKVSEEAVFSSWMPENQAFKPSRTGLTLAGLWLSRFDFYAIRNRKRVYGYQFDLERLEPVGKFNLVGKNIAHISSMPHSYGHELNFAVCGSFLMGSWFNLNTANFGCAQFYIHSTNDRMTGLHTGNTNDNRVEPGSWEWIRLCDYEQTANLVTRTSHKRLRDHITLDDKFKSWFRRGKPISVDEMMLD